MLCFTFVFEGKFQVQASPGGIYLEGRFNGGFFALRFWGAYNFIWRGLFSEFYGIVHSAAGAISFFQHLDLSTWPLCVRIWIMPLRSGVQSLSPLIKLIEGVQRHATRLLLPNLTYNERLQQLNLLPFVYQREVKDITTFYKLKCGYYNDSVERYFDFCSDKRLRSYSSNKLKINQVRTVRNYSKALFSIDHHIYGTTSLINSGPLI